MSDDKKEESAPVVAEADSTTEQPQVEEEIVKMEDILQEYHRLEEQADILFATQDPSNCTYAEGYKPRQTVFTCLTCTPAPQMAGFCYGCSMHCHDGHDLVELYTKRKFRCDCGNSKFGENKCTLYEEKDAKNEYNSYNHNYHGKFCTCEVFYPEDDTGRELDQCEICEDWFHLEHGPVKVIAYEVEGASDEAKEEMHSFICEGCVKKHPFISQMQPGKDVICHSKKEQKAPSSSEEAPTALSIANFRTKLCKCKDCTSVYDMADCEFLLDDEDDMMKYETESKRLVAEKEAAQPTEQEEMREFVKEYGMDGAKVLYEGINNFKRKFAEFMGTMEEGKPINVADVERFKDSLKRPRHE